MKRTWSKIRNFQLWKKKRRKFHTYSSKKTAGMKVWHNGGYYESCESSGGLGFWNPVDFWMEYSPPLKYWWANLRYRHPGVKEAAVCSVWKIFYAKFHKQNSRKKMYVEKSKDIPSSNRNKLYLWEKLYLNFIYIHVYIYFCSTSFSSSLQFSF